VVADHGAAGVAQARALLPDLVLLDMQLPDIDGIRVLELLRQDEATRGLRVAALSANAMPEDVTATLRAGACAYWTKPIDFAPFLDKVRALLQEGRGLRQRAG
jgi:CheY-like chemotaxis protein